jgi:hypothetical protein
MTTISTTTIEMVSFKLNDNVTKEQMIATNPAMKTFLNKQPGFLYRSLSCDDHNQWFDVVYWASLEHAQQGGEAFMKSDACATLMPLIDTESCKMRHMNALSEILSDTLATKN